MRVAITQHPGQPMPNLADDYAPELLNAGMKAGWGLPHADRQIIPFPL